MGRQRINSQMKGKEEESETMLTEKEASKLSDTEFKENYQKLQGNDNELIANYINMKEEIETINKGQKEMKNTILELKNTVEGMKSRLDEAEDQISELQDKVEKNTQKEKKRKRGSEKMKRD